MTAGVYAQSETKIEHGTEVRSAAQATYDGPRGAEVSSTASVKSRSAVKASDDRAAAREARKARKAQRQEASAALKAETKATAAGLNEELRSTVKAGSGELKDQRAEARADLKADLKSSRTELADARAELGASKRELRKAARKERKELLPVKAKVRTETGVQLRRPKINGNLNAGAALGL